MNIKWDTDKYTKQFSFVHEYGNSLMELIERKKGQTILDLGCGNGALTKELSNHGFQAVGMDESQEMIDAAKRNYPELIFYQGDATHFELSKKWILSFLMLCSTG